MPPVQLGLLLPGILLLALGISPRRRHRRPSAQLPRLVRWLAAAQGACAAWALLATLQGNASWLHLTSSPRISWNDSPWQWTLHELWPHLDTLACLMLLLVSFIGWVVAGYSQRYLAGDPHQGSHFRWLAVTVGSVCLMVSSGSLLGFATLWGLASLGTHRLLLHYPSRPGAVSAAWTKFAVSRAGDVFLLFGLGLLYSEVGSSRFATINSPLPIAPEASSGLAWLFVIAACLKSAQFPFHSWLPQTVETPTPVSALMHAGIVNAGGFLLIRVNPFLAGQPGPLVLLIVVGTLTAVVGGIIMMAQSSIKRSLAYSTVAQMGFMMLQVGLGAFAAAFVHIVAHALYKAYAFLNSGSVLAEQQGLHRGTFNEPVIQRQETSRPMSMTWAAQGIGAVAVIFMFAWALQVFGIHPNEKAGGWLLSGIVCLALISGVLRALRSLEPRVLVTSLFGAGLLSVTYVASFWLSDRLLSPASPTYGLGTIIACCFTGLAFVGLFVLHLRIETASRLKNSRNTWQSRAYVHALNGFYLEAIWGRLLGLHPSASTRTFGGLN